MLLLEPFGLTDAGRVRKNNEDDLLVGEGKDSMLFAVADGIGGFEAGEVASSMAIEVLKKMEPGEPFQDAIGEANRRIRTAARGDERLSGMGTTVVAVRFGEKRGDPVAEVAHVGDSRAYLLRGGDLNPITEDHSLVAELVRSGDLTRAEAAEHPQKNLITRALGAEESVAVDTAVFPVEPGDRFVLCSDGLTDMVSDDHISEILNDAGGDPETSVRRLLSAALEAGGTDNVTVVVVGVEEQREQPAAKEDRSDGTREMPTVAPPAAPPAEHGRRSGGAQRRVRTKRRSGAGRLIGKLIRGLALILVVLVLLTPVYLWGSSRYFLEFEGGEVVVYRGLPTSYTLGVVLNEEWRETGIEAADIKPQYRKQIGDHKLYTRDEVEKVLRGLGRS